MLDCTFFCLKMMLIPYHVYEKINLYVPVIFWFSFVLTEITN